MKSLLRSKLIGGLLIGCITGPFVFLALDGWKACGTEQLLGCMVGGGVGLLVGFWLDARASCPRSRE